MDAEYGFNVCRMCMATENLVSLFEKANENELKIFQEIGGIDISQDKKQYVAFVCQNCLDKLRRFVNQRKKIQIIDKFYVRKERGKASESVLPSSSTSECDTGVLFSQKSNVNDKKCTVCGKTFYSKGNMLQHLSYMHENKRTYSCDICGNQYYKIYQIRTHMINNHTVRHLKTLDKSRLFKCDKCPKGFKSYMESVQHQAVHTDYRPYICRCGKAFKQLGQLSNHQKNVHSNTRPFVCHCGKSFKQEGILKTHQRNIHKKF